MGPTWHRLFDSQVQLDDGQTVQADATFISKKIRQPDQVTVAGYPKGLMGPSIQQYQSQLARQDTMSALLAYIQSLH